jgi:hypothetical protein
VTYRGNENHRKGECDIVRREDAQTAPGEKDTGLEPVRSAEMASAQQGIRETESGYNEKEAYALCAHVCDPIKQGRSGRHLKVEIVIAPGVVYQNPTNSQAAQTIDVGNAFCL